MGRYVTLLWTKLYFLFQGATEALAEMAEDGDSQSVAFAPFLVSIIYYHRMHSPG